MAGGKSKVTRVKRLAGEDMISKLPDSLLSEILLYLPTKEAIRTSVLSNRWKSVWRLIPGLDLDSSEFQNYGAFVSVMEKFLDFSRREKSCFYKLKLSIRMHVNDRPCIRRWIDFVASRNKLKHLDLECLDQLNRGWWEGMPSSLYMCETLVYLRLHRVLLGSFESISLPLLKTIHLELNIYFRETDPELLISSCPVLEDCRIVRRVNDNVKNLRVHSETLISLDVGYDFGVNRSWISGLDRENSGLLIDAPKLKYLNFKDELSTRKIVSNMSSLAKVSFDRFFYGDLSQNQLARDFFKGISRVRDMTISKNAMKFFNTYLKVESLPKFCHVSRLEAGFCLSDIEILPTLLESFPKLKSIILDLTNSDSLMAPIRTSSVPQCMLSSLEFVEMNSRFEGRSVETEVARYFVKNSVVLKKLVLHLSNSREKQSLEALRDLMLIALLKPSSMCRIVCFSRSDQLD